MTNKKYRDKYQTSKKSLIQEVMELKIENQVIKKQLVAIRDMLNNILKDTDNEEELIIKYIKKHYAGLENLKKCANCRKVGNWEKSFCPNCLTKSESAKEAQVNSAVIKEEQVIDKEEAK